MKKDKLILFFKGIAMGIADLVPGVSGGTIAFITNIYHELINTIKSFDLNSINFLLKLNFKSFYDVTNLKFLLPLILGIITSIILFVSFISNAFEHFPIHIFSLFFGLVIFSSISIIKSLISKNSILKLDSYLYILFGIILGIIVSMLNPLSVSNNLISTFFSGMIAICAMILPGISGSYILLILGKYFYIIEALKTLNVLIISTFSAGALIGILSFSRIISWLLKKHYKPSMFFLSGLMLGSINKIWPWKIENKNVSPFHYSELLDESNYFIESIIIFLIAGFIIFIFDKRKSEIND